MIATDLRESLVDSAYALGWSAVRLMPERAAYAAFQRLADQTYARQGEGVQMLRSNLRRVVGPNLADADLDRLTQAGMRSYLRYWCEVFRLPSWSAAKVNERVVVRDAYRLWDGLDSGRGVVLALPHSANWDAGAAWVGISGRVGGDGPTYTTVAERLRPESLFDRFVAYRESLGLEVLPHTGEANLVGQLARRLRAGGLVVLPADRDVAGTGIDVDFFGERARMPGGPAALAHLTGATLLVLDLWYSGGATHVQIHPPLELSANPDRRARIAETTQLVASTFERGIAAHPEDWHMMQPLWVADLDRRDDAPAEASA